MKEKVATVKGIDYTIKVEKLQDGSFNGGIFCYEKQLVKMSLSATDSSDIRNARGEDPSDLILRLLVSYAESGFLIGKIPKFVE